MDGGIPGSDVSQFGGVNTENHNRAKRTRRSGEATMIQTNIGKRLIFWHIAWLLIAAVVAYFTRGEHIFNRILIAIVLFVAWVAASEQMKKKWNQGQRLPQP